MMKINFIHKILLLFLAAAILPGILHAHLAQQYFDSTSVLMGKGSYKPALEIAKKALEQAVQEFGVKDTNYIRVIPKLVEIYFNLSEYDSALTYSKLDSALRSEVQGKESLEYAQSLNDLAMLYTNRGRYSEAEPLFKEALLIKKNMFGTENEEYAYSLNNLAWFYSNMGRYLEAEPLYIEALQIRKNQLGVNDPNYAVSLNNLAMLYSDMGRFKDAEPLYREALQIRKEQLGEDHPQYAGSLNNLAAIQKKLGNYAEAETLYRKAQEKREKQVGKKHPYYGLAISNLAEIYRLMGRFEEAEKLFEEAMNIYKEKLGTKHAWYAISLKSLATVYINMEKYEKAEPLYKEALRIRKEQFGEKHPSYAQSLYDLALLYDRMGRLREAEKLYISSLNIRKEQLGEKHPYYATSLSTLAGLYVKEGKYNEALPMLEESMKIRKEQLGKSHPEYLQSLLSYAQLMFLMGKYAESEPFFKEALAMNMNIINKTFPSLSEKEKSQFYNTIKINFEKFNSFATERMADAPSILSDMFDYRLSTKALLLNSTKKVRQRILNSGDSSLIKLYIDWQGKKDYLAKLYNLPQDKLAALPVSADTLEMEANDLEKELSRKSELFSKEFEKKDITWKDVQSRLNDNEAAVEILRFRKFGKCSDISIYDQVIPGMAYILPVADEIQAPGFTDTVYYAALIITKETAKNPEIVLLPNGKELEEVYVKGYTKIIKNHQYALWTQRDEAFMPQEVIELMLEELYTEFWKKIGDEIKGKQVVYLSLDGVYNQLNLNTLLDPETEKYLTEEIELNILTNTKDLVELGLSGNKKQPNIAELFADPLYNLDTTSVKHIPQLPGTRAEVDKISKALRKMDWSADEFIGIDATEEKIKNVNNPKVLHIATHGRFLKDVEVNTGDLGEGESENVIENPLLRAYLYFAGAENSEYSKSHKSSPNEPELKETNGEDGLLTAFEAMNLNLDNTDLVVLSACETGLGEVKNGEGVYGLQRAFQVAGSKSLIMSLWNVSDKAAQELMCDFYNNWLSGMDKRDAFRKAQLALKQNYPDFYFWGSFVMIGE